MLSKGDCHLSNQYLIFLLLQMLTQPVHRQSNLINILYFYFCRYKVVKSQIQLSNQYLIFLLLQILPAEQNEHISNQYLIFLLLQIHSITMPLLANLINILYFYFCRLFESSKCPPDLINILYFYFCRSVPWSPSITNLINILYFYFCRYTSLSSKKCI